MTAPNVVSVDEVHCVAYWHNVVIVDIGGDIGLVHMRALGEAYEALRQSYPKGIAALVIAQPNTPVGGEDARGEGARMLKAMGDGLLHICVVIEERGVLAPLMRSVLRGVNVIVRNARLSIAETVEEAAKGVTKHVALSQPKAAVEQELLAAIESVRRTFASSPERAARLSRQRNSVVS
jgi:hypothetical protein